MLTSCHCFVTDSQFRASLIAKHGFINSELLHKGIRPTLGVFRDGFGRSCWKFFHLASHLQDEATTVDHIQVHRKSVCQRRCLWFDLLDAVVLLLGEDDIFTFWSASLHIGNRSQAVHILHFCCLNDRDFCRSLRHAVLSGAAPPKGESMGAVNLAHRFVATKS